jgi:ABC-type Na+ efflux pump permease subunit
MQRSWEKIWLIVRREYLARVQRRSFVIVTAAMAVIFVLLACAPIIVQAIRNGKESTTKIVLIDTTGTGAAKDLISQIQQDNAKAVGNTGLDMTTFVEIDAPSGTVKTDAGNGSMTINAPPNTVIIRADNTTIGVSSTSEGRRYQINNGNVAGFLVIERNQ